MRNINVLNVAQVLIGFFILVKIYSTWSVFKTRGDRFYWLFLGVYTIMYSFLRIAHDNVLFSRQPQTIYEIEKILALMLGGAIGSLVCWFLVMVGTKGRDRQNMLNHR